MSRRIRKGFILSFLILSCVQVLSVLALEDSIKLDDQDLKVSKAMKEIEGKVFFLFPFLMISIYIRFCMNRLFSYAGFNSGRENMKKNDEVKLLHSVFPKKSQKSKGSYGGANLVHRRPGEKSAAPALPNISIFIHLCIIISFYFCLPPFPFLIV